MWGAEGKRERNSECEGKPDLNPFRKSKVNTRTRQVTYIYIYIYI